jgi:hypothetical protein
MSPPPGDDTLVAVEGHLRGALGADRGRASVSFVGVERLDVLRFGPDEAGLVHYVTLGMARRPMSDPTVGIVDGSGPRAELVLALRGAVDSVLRSLAVLAATPAVEGVVVRPGSSFELGAPLWEGSPFTGVLVDEPGLVPDLVLTDGGEPVRFLPVLPVTPHEQAYKRVHGPDALRTLWADQGLDLRAPSRPAARLPAT